MSSLKQEKWEFAAADEVVERENVFSDSTSTGAVLVEPELDAASPVGAKTPFQKRRNSWPHVAQMLRTGAPLFLCDLLVLAASMLAARGCCWFLFPDNPFASFTNQLAAATALTVVVFPAFNLYPGAGLHPVYEFRQQTLATLAVWTALVIANQSFGRLALFESILLGLAWLLVTVCGPIARNVTRALASRTKWWGERALVVGGGEQGRALYQGLLRKASRGLRPVGVVEELHTHWNGEENQDVAYAGAPKEITKLALRHDAYWAVFAMADRSSVQSALAALDRRPAWMPNMVYVPNLKGLPSLWSRTQEFADRPGIHVYERLFLPSSRIVKRLLDVVLSTVGLCCLAPMLAATAAAIKLSSKGPLFFGHERIGRDGRKFTAWKFRTMHVNAKQLLSDCLARDSTLLREWQETHKLKKDPRIIPGIGAFLRKYSLDELPQLYNVLRGEMSLVGPRPIVEAEAPKYADYYRFYVRVTPGLTGLWQVSGRNNTTYDERVQYDAYYVQNWSIWMDLYILARTIKTVLCREGAY